MAKCTFYDFIKASNHENNHSSSSSSSDTEVDINNNNKINSKDRKQRKNLRLHSKQREALIKHADQVSIDTDLDSIYANDDATEAANFDYNSRMDFILKGYLPRNDDDSPVDNRILPNRRPSGVYGNVESAVMECAVCCDEQFLNRRACCGFLSCNLCVDTYVQTQIKKSCGSIKIECLNSTCSSLFHKAEIIERMTAFDKDSLRVYLKFLVEVNKDPNCK